MTDISLLKNEIISNFENIAGKLSIFTENELKYDKGKEKSHEILERPVTPVEQEIKDAPSSLKEFIYLLQRRIEIPKNSFLSESEKLSLLGIIEGEISLLWSDLKSLVDYPLFNDDQNRELRATIFIEIIKKCKLLFDEYAEKMNLYCSRDIFSDESNLVRIRLQLASDIRHKLHIPTLRRQIYQNISQNIHIKIPECCAVPSIVKEEENFQMELHDSKSRRTDTNEVRASLTGIVSAKLVHKYNEEKNHVNQFSDTVGQSQSEQKITEFSVPNIDEENNYQMNSNLLLKEEDLLKKKEDLLLLVRDDMTDDEKDCFPKMAHAMPAFEKYKLRNDDIQKRIEILKRQNEDTEQSTKYIIRPPLVPQPSTVPICYNNTVYNVPDIRPTERKSDSEITLLQYGPLWNELADEITPETVRKLDSNLFRGEEVKDIYKEMMKTVSRDYMNYADDPIIEDCPSKVYIRDIMASHSLYTDIKKDRTINPKLRVYTESPWKMESMSRSDWKYPNFSLENPSKSDLDLQHYVNMSINEISKANFGRESYEEVSSELNSLGDMNSSLTYAGDATDRGKYTPMRNIIPKQDYILSSNNFEKGISRLPKLMRDRLMKQYNEWLAFWKRSFNTEDFLKYLSLQPSDFLSVVFHNYDSENEDDSDNDNDDDYDLFPDIVEQKIKMHDREKERMSILEDKVITLQHEKYHYEKGLWNPSTVLIGGLGKTPKLSNNEKIELLKDKPSLPDPNDSLNKRTAYSRARSAVSPGKPTPLFVRKKVSQNRSESPDNQLICSNEDRRLEIIQNHLEQIWNKLKMPNHLRLDMAIKYSSEVNVKSIETVLKLWDSATTLLLKRETVLSELEDFERFASDPNRFFAKGFRGSSLARLEESKVRQDLNEKIDHYSLQIKEVMKDLRQTCSDELSYDGRPYGDKMAWDRTEMLYWLQEERKDRSLNGISDNSTIN